MKSAEQQQDNISIIGASQNNLKNVDVTIPSDRLTVITGVSGSGKSSLAFDTLYAEGQRRYVESLSAYARQFLERIQKPRVHEILGIRPAIAIRQKNSSRNPRSTVGTVTELYDYLRLLFSRAGTVICRDCGREVKKDTVDDVVKRVESLGPGRRLYFAVPFQDSGLASSDRENPDPPLAAVAETLLRQGFSRLLDPEGQIIRLPAPALESLVGYRLLIDRLVLSESDGERIADSLESSFAAGKGVAEVMVLPGDEDPGIQILRFSERLECQYCKVTYRDPEPLLFSFNNPYGACATCHGFGNTISIDPGLVIPDQLRTLREGPVEPFCKPRYRRNQERLLEYLTARGVDLDLPYRDLSEELKQAIWEGDGAYSGVVGFFRRLERKKYKMHVRILISRYRGYTVCPDCGGERLCREARDVLVGGLSITQLTAQPISQLCHFFDDLQLEAEQAQIADKLLHEIRQRLSFLKRVGLDYLALDRLTSTLSGGEMQRIHLAASLGSSLVGALYVLDEPSIGLHARDEYRLIEILKSLRDLGNTIVVVEHERAMMEAADQIIDMGPGAGEQGGEVIHSGDYSSLCQNPDSLTGQYLSGTMRIQTPVFRRSNLGKQIVIEGARQHNLKNLTVQIPLGVLVCITGVSGSGKSTLVHQTLYAGLQKMRGEWKHSVGTLDRLEGWDYPSEVLMVDQSPIGKTPRSNPVTYVKAFDEIRALFASLPAARGLGFKPGFFSFNIPGGRCETCQGAGTITVEMQFLADVELVCEDCKGLRYQNRILDIRFKGKNIAEVLSLTLDQALVFFRGLPKIIRKLKVLHEVGLGYLRLGQSATTLSGGEAQRIKLAAYLGRKTSSQPLLILDEPTTGLHFEDINRLLAALQKLTANGGSVVIIEHNLDVIKSADWIIDLGPEGGAGGGELLAQGTPEEVAAHPTSHTARFLRAVLAADRNSATNS